MRILVLGGDGYLGWPTALHLSRRGHDVGVVDNFVRRQYDHEMGVDSLVPISQLQHRVRIWEEVSGLKLETFIGDLTDPVFVDNTSSRFEPEAVVHFAEQRSAPYSMIDRQHAVYTQVNNVVGTLNLLYAIAERDPSIHLVKLGHHGRVRHAQHRHRRGLHRDHPQGPDRHAALPEAARAPSTTCPRSTTATTSSSPAGSGDCGPPT